MKQRSIKNKVLLSSILLAAALITGVLMLRFGMQKYYDVRYPLHYSSIIEAGAKKNNLPLSFVYAVVHTESVFDPEAVSVVDARGLMQITRDTFDWIQHKMAVKKPLDYDESVFDPAVNVSYGTYLLRILYEEFGSYDLALCAYHAGRGNVKKWLRDPELSSDGKTVDTIPFSDTRWYVDRVNETQKVYQELYNLE